MKVMVIPIAVVVLEKRVKELEVRERMETTQITALLESV